MTSQLKASVKKAAPAPLPKARKTGATVNDNRRVAENNNRREARGTTATINTIKDKGYRLVSFDGKQAVFQRPKTRALIGAAALLGFAGMYLACGGIGAHLVGIALLAAGFYQGGKPAEVFSIDFDVPRKTGDDF